MSRYFVREFAEAGVEVLADGLEVQRPVVSTESAGFTAQDGGGCSPWA